MYLAVESRPLSRTVSFVPQRNAHPAAITQTWHVRVFCCGAHVGVRSPAEECAQWAAGVCAEVASEAGSSVATRVDPTTFQRCSARVSQTFRGLKRPQGGSCHPENVALPAEFRLAGGEHSRTSFAGASAGVCRE